MVKRCRAVSAHALGHATEAGNSPKAHRPLIVPVHVRGVRGSVCTLISPEPAASRSGIRTEDGRSSPCAGSVKNVIQLIPDPGDRFSKRAFALRHDRVNGCLW